MNKKLAILLLTLIVFTVSQVACDKFLYSPELDFSKEKIKEIDRVIQTLYENEQFIFY